MFQVQTEGASAWHELRINWKPLGFNVVDHPNLSKMSIVNSRQDESRVFRLPFL